MMIVIYDKGIIRYVIFVLLVIYKELDSVRFSFGQI